MKKKTQAKKGVKAKPIKKPAKAKKAATKKPDKKRSAAAKKAAVTKLILKQLSDIFGKG